MKILFLDIDGVLNSERSVLGGTHRMKNGNYENDKYYAKFTHSTIDHTAVDLINRIVRELDVKIVLSSSHRSHFPDGDNKLALIREYLTFLGLDGNACIGFTPKLHTKRGIEIKDWLNTNPKDITHYAIVDDDADMMEEQKPFFVRTNSSEGISAQNYRDLTRIFGQEDSGLVYL